MKSYFSALNYSLANEDSRVERSASQSYSTALAVCGSGSRAFSLIHPNLKRLRVIDISAPQLEFAKFKWELMRKLPYEKYLKFMGYMPAALDQRLDVIESIELSAFALQYYRSIPETRVEQGIIYSGRWEAKLIKLGQIITSLTFHDFHKNFVQVADRGKIWPRQRLRAFVKVFANSWVLDTFVYQGQMVKSDGIRVEDFLIQNFEQIFLKEDPRNSFFHQMLFLGELKFKEGLPVDVSEDVYGQIQEYKGDIEFINADLVQAVKDYDFEFGSFSNVPSYFTVEQNKLFESLLLERFSKGARKVVMRSFLKHRGIINSDLKKKNNSEESQSAEHQDGTHLYKFQILENI